MSTPLHAAEDELVGHVEIGVRAVDVDGDNGKYKQHVNEGSGVRLFGLGWRYTPEQTAGGIPDLVAIDAYGLGGDPYQNAQLEVRKYGRYRVRYEHRKSDYFYQDLLIAPELVDIEASNEGDLHRFDFERTTDRAAVEVQLNARAKLLFGYDRYQKQGASTTVLDIQREEFELDSPLDQESQQIDVGFEYAWDAVTLTFHERWREFDNDVRIFSPGASEGLDPDGPTQIDSYTFLQPYDYSSREHQLGLLLRPSPRLQMKVDALVTQLDMDVDHVETGEGVDFMGLPFQTDLNSAGAAERDIQQLFASVSYAVSDQLRLIASAREQRLDQEASRLQMSSSDSEDWELASRRVTLGFEAVPASEWVIAGGWSRQRRTVEFQAAAAGPVTVDRESADNDGFWLSLSYRPSERLDWRASIEDHSVDNAYTSASATQSRRYRLRARYRFDSGTLLTASHQRREHDNDWSDWRSDSAQTTVRLAHNAADLALSAGYTWVELDQQIDQLVRGGFRQDLFAIDYDADTDFWDAAVDWSPTPRLTLSASHTSYRNRGSFASDREDTRVGFSVAFAERYRLHARFRKTDFAEPPAERFDADVFELAIGYTR